MKKTIAFLLTLGLLLSLLTACGSREPAADAQEEAVTAEKAAEEGSVQLLLPYDAQAQEWMLVTKEDGTRWPKVTFTYIDVSYTYCVEPAAETEPYDFSGLELETPWEDGTMQVEDITFAMQRGDNGAWCSWIETESALAYEVYSTDPNVEDISFMASILAFAEDYQEPTDGEAEWTETQLTGAMLLPGFCWKYEDRDVYIHMAGNGTYAIYDSDLTTDGIIRFWRVQEGDDTVAELLAEDGSVAMTLRAEGDYESLTVTDGEGAALSRYGIAMPGTYYCGMNTGFLTDGDLTLTAQMVYWYTDEEVSALAVGGTLTHPINDFFDEEITALEKQDDTHMTINEAKQLVYVESAGAWKLTEDFDMWEQVGHCAVTDATVFTDTADDGAHATLEECLAANEYIYCNVTVENGTATAIEVVEVW